MAILLFDGECHLCDRSVQFILKQDRTESIQFASLQSNVGKHLLKVYGIPETINSLVFIEETTSFIRSDAILHIIPYLNKRWRIGYLALFLPRTQRNHLYDWVAKNRYKWFGKKTVCDLPSPKTRARFLDQL